jgi:hypothetical protein
MAFTWYEVPQPEGKKLPKWTRSAAISDDGKVFIPCAIGGDEQEVFLCTLYDHTPSVEYLNHHYVPSDWLAKEFPDAKETAEFIASKIRSWYNSENPLSAVF